MFQTCYKCQPEFATFSVAGEQRSDNSALSSAYRE